MSELSALATVAAIAAGETSASDEVEAAIDRIEATDGNINAVVVRDFDRARVAADRADEAIGQGIRAPLLGLPMTVKEAFDVAGLPTSWGLDHARDNVASGDAVAVRRLKDAGAIILGKTNVPPGLGDWQSDNPVYGATSNPIDVAYTAGGSSGGSAAALAAGMVALELGSDVGGSIRVPAHFCGVWGHNPSFDAIPLEGHRFPGRDGANPPLGAVGPMARNADDLAAALDVLAHRSLGVGDVRDAKGLRILLLVDHPEAPTDPAIRTAVERAGAALEAAGANVDAVSDLLPNLAAQHHNYTRMLAISMARGAPSPAGKVATLADWFDILDEQARSQRAWRAVFARYDAVLAPPNAVTAFKQRTDAFDDRRLTIAGQDMPYDVQLMWAGLATYPGLPATCFPAGCNDDGLPVGIQVMCDLYQDHRAISVARIAHGALQ